MVFYVKIKAYADPDPLLWPSHFLPTSAGESRKQEYFHLLPYFILFYFFCCIVKNNLIQGFAKFCLAGSSLEDIKAEKYPSHFVSAVSVVTAGLLYSGCKVDNTEILCSFLFFWDFVPPEMLEKLVQWV